MVQEDGSIRLVDYDGIYLPQFRGERSPELGHRNFQHPLRSSEDYDDYVDNFPSLVIYLSLLAVASDPDLWDFHDDGENLIFKKVDYAAPESSELFNRLKNSPSHDVVELTKYLEECCAIPVEKVPDLESALQEIQTGTAPSDSVPHPSIAPGPMATDAAGQGYRQVLQEQQSLPSQSAARPMTPSGQPTAVSQSTATVQIPQPNVVPGTSGRKLRITALTIAPGHSYCGCCAVFFAGPWEHSACTHSDASASAHSDCRTFQSSSATCRASCSDRCWRNSYAIANGHARTDINPCPDSDAISYTANLHTTAYNHANTYADTTAYNHANPDSDAASYEHS